MKRLLAHQSSTSKKEIPLVLRIILSYLVDFLIVCFIIWAFGASLVV
jgi:hypothetical protein